MASENTEWDFDPPSANMESNFDATIYSYTSLDPEKHEIRLLSFSRLPYPNISGMLTDEMPLDLRLETMQLDLAPAYSALSYPLGSVATQGTFALVTIDGKAFALAANLVAALQTIQSRADIEYLWVGAVCIDECDIAEKNNQVPLMRHIYKRAVEVFMWLEETPETRGALPCLQAMAMSWHQTSQHIRPSPATFNIPTTVPASQQQDFLDAFHENLIRNQANGLHFWQTISALLQLPSWHCLWVLQGLVMAARGTVLCEQHSIRITQLEVLFRTFTHIIFLGYIYIGSGPPENLNLRAARNRAQRTFCLRFRLYYLLQQGALRLAAWGLNHLAVLIRSSQMLQATDPRDKMFALLGLLELKEGQTALKVDYGLHVTPATVFGNATLDMMARTRRYPFIGGIGGFLYGEATTAAPGAPGWPSWVPNFNTAEELTLAENPWVAPLRGMLVVAPDFDAATILGPVGSTIPVIALRTSCMFSASAGRPCDWTFDGGASLLTMRGFVCDEIAGAYSMDMSTKFHVWTLHECIETAKRFRLPAEKPSDPGA